MTSCHPRGVLAPPRHRLPGAAFLFASAIVAGSASADFTITGNMVTPRDHHTATLLDDGRVLITGGISRSAGRGITADAELYDPASGTFGATGSLAVPRVDHAASRLPDGRVLVVGGYGNDQTQANAELYDPASGTFAPVASDLDVGGERTTVTTLLDGRALVVGGFLGGARSESFLFDPATDTFSATGSLNHRRYVHTATLLADGRVFVAGGLGEDLYDSAEIYDPASGTFSDVEDTMAYRRERHAATLLADGRVLIAGGYTTGDQLDTAEWFDPASGTFTTSADVLGLPRVDFAMQTLGDGKVLIVGAYQWGLSAGTADLYDPGRDEFQAIEPGPSTERDAPEATLLADGRVLVSGGHDQIDVKVGWVPYGEIFEPAATDLVFANGFE
jgi:hypothetical protein